MIRQNIAERLLRTRFVRLGAIIHPQRTNDVYESEMLRREYENDQLRK